MDDEPPPLPPKMRSAAGGRYTQQDIAKALEEENKEYERIKREKLVRSQSHRTQPVKESTSQEGYRTQSLIERGSSRPIETKPRPRPTTTATSQPSPKPRNLNITKTDSNNLQEPTLLSRKGSDAGFSNLSAEKNGSRDTSSSSSQQDLISFNSPEKPKNDILEFLHNVNASQSALVPVSRQSYNSMQSTVGPTSSLSTYQGALSPVFTGVQWPVTSQNGVSYSSLSSPSPIVSYRPSFNQAIPIMNFPASSQSQVVSTVSPALTGSLSAPPLPQRCPVFELPHLNSQVSHLSLSQNASSPSLSLVSSGVGGSGVGASEMSIVSAYSSKKGKSPASDDLIDLDVSMSRDVVDDKATKCSVLDVFDPIVLKAKEEEEVKRRKSLRSGDGDGGEGSERGDTTGVPISKDARELLQFKSSKKRNDDEMSYYEQVDPFEYMHPGASSTRSDPVYDIYDGLVSPGAVGADTFDIPPPLPPRTAKEAEIELRKSSFSPSSKHKQYDKVSQEKLDQDAAGSSAKPLKKSKKTKRRSTFFSDTFSPELEDPAGSQVEIDSLSNPDGDDKDMSYELKTRRSENHWYMISYDESIQIADDEDDEQCDRIPTAGSDEGFVAEGDDSPPLSPLSFADPVEDSPEMEELKKTFFSLVEKRSAVLFDGKSSSGQILLRKIPALNADDEARAFWDCIKKRRVEYTWDDHVGNPGLLHSSCIEGSEDPNLSVKLKVYYGDKTLAFTCNLNSSVEHVVMHTVCTLELEGESADYVLKVRGIDDYLSGETALGEYEYVHTCIKYDQDVSFTLLHADSVKRSYQRTEEDDDTVLGIQVEDLMSAGSGEVVHYETLIIVVETFETELTRLQNAGFLLIDGTPLQDLPTPMRSRRLRQVVKHLCALLGKLETIEVTEAISSLVSTCRTIQLSQGILDGEDDFPGQRVLSTGSHDFSSSDDLKHMLLDSLSRLSGAVNSFLGMYAKAFRVDFTVDATVDNKKEAQEVQDVREKVSVKVQGLHRLHMDWKYDEYFVEAQLFHGSRCIGQPTHSLNKKVIVDPKFYPKVVFSQCLDIGTRFNTLPRESRLVMTVFGLKIIEAENKVEQPKYIREELGWAAIQYFSFSGHLAQGAHLLTLWPMASDRRLGPAPYSSDHPQVHGCPVLSVKLMDFGGEILFPEIVPLPPKKLEFSSLDINTQQQLSDIIERDIFTFNKGSAEDREILWEKRHYLHEEPFALAKVLLAAHSWDVSCLPDLHSLVKNWSAPAPADALHLLLPCFADSVVRARAIEWIKGLGSDELVTFLPQLVQAVKHEAWDVSPTAELLLERALTSPRLAHHLYWLLNQCLPLQTNMGGEREVVSDARYRRRLNLVTRALMAICGKNMENRLLTQEAILRSLYATAMNIKDIKDSQRMHVLSRDLENIHFSLEANPTSLPLSPSLEVAGVDVKNCSYFNSFTVPLRLAFLSSEEGTDPIHAILKVGDDLRQDMLVIQMIRLMDKLWLKEDLDLKVVTFSVVPTGDKIGIIELVKDAETLRKIQTEYGVTGSFQDRPIAEWLAKQNPSQLEYQRAVKNFTASCAAYCVATYILGICDRHNDNIMLKTSGHLFHIDFGKFLGDAQKFGNFKRDRTPFVLTSDMAYVINGGEKPSDKFQGFVDLCCRAFNIIRRNGQLLLYLFALMASSGIPGVTLEAVTYVERSLLQDKTNAEAGAMFSRMIQESLKSWFTQVNFFIHNLAQLRFSGDHNDDLLLSFIPRTYTEAQDGKISLVRLYSYQKRYNPNKYYVYILQVEREGQREPSYLFRSYREFSEFHQKLCLVFPLARIHSLPKGVQIGRSEVKAVAEKRKYEIELFLATLFDLAPEISHSELVYTFFHPLLRDQEDTDIHIRKLKNKDTRMSVTPPMLTAPGQVQGQVKVSFQYLRGQLQIMVHHARNLSLISNNQEPSPYVKLYLLPDPHKKTKRKTKVVKKTCHPTFMEPITYRMSQDIVKQRVLEISVWSEDKFSENMYLGSSYLRLSNLELKEEHSEWLSLEHQRNTALGHTIQHSA